MQEERDGRWWCEGDGCYVDEPVHRYMMTVKLMDPTGEAYATVFNEQVRHSSSRSCADSLGSQPASNCLILSCAAHRD